MAQLCFTLIHIFLGYARLHLHLPLHLYLHLHLHLHFHLHLSFTLNLHDALFCLQNIANFVGKTSVAKSHKITQVQTKSYQGALKGSQNCILQIKSYASYYHTSSNGIGDYWPKI